MKTKITELFGIEHPIIQGGMHHVGFAELMSFPKIQYCRQAFARIRSAAQTSNRLKRQEHEVPSSDK